MKKIVVVATVLGALLALSGCNEKKNFILATGGTSGTYYPFGGAIANIWLINIRIPNQYHIKLVHVLPLL